MPGGQAPIGVPTEEDPSRDDRSARVARFLTRYAGRIHLATLLLLVACALFVALRVHFSSDVLDLFPEKFDSVRVWKTANREFAQGRSLSFILQDETGACDLDEFALYFGKALRQEPWAVRVMDQLPLGDDRARDEAQALFIPLLLNLPADEFSKFVDSLQPATIQQGLEKSMERLKAGSFRDEQMLAIDPLGVLAPALRQLGASNMEQTFSLSSPDGTVRLVLAVTNQDDLGAHASQAMMRQVDDFNRRVLAAWTGPKPKVLVTGRTAFVGELSQKMRSDVLGTLFLSAALVSVVFWLGFRRVRPLFAIMHVLLLCCVAAVGFGGLVFHELNMITIGLCSILIGLGVDFGMMLYAIYEVARDAGETHEQAVATALRSQGRSVIFGALTSAAAFLCHMLSGCPGFIQLGALIAFGILFAGLFMMTVFFVSISREHRPRRTDPLRHAAAHFVHWMFAHYHAVWIASGAVLAALTLFAVSPCGTLRFDANPRTLEPPGSAAGHALRLLAEKMPGFGEQLIVLLETQSAAETQAGWSALKTGWVPQVEQGRLKRVSMFAGALTLNAARVEANARRLASVDLSAAGRAFQETLARTDGQPLFARGDALLHGLAAVAAGHREPLDWRHALAPRSCWWFLLDQFFGADPNITEGYVTPLAPITTLDEKENLRKLLESHAGGVAYHISGWSYTLQDLVPWAKGKLLELSAAIIAFNVLLLAFLYRRVFPLFVLMLSLALSIGALLASLKLFGVALNVFNVLAFPLVIGVGVDYGIYVVIAMRTAGDVERSVGTIVKPVLLSGLTAVAGFGSLAFAENPALRGLGVVSALGIAWCLLSTFCFVLPVYIWRRVR